ncbi:MAG: hypothetical protein WC980_09000 [Candidatus Brocadiia bacterium]
MKQIIKFVKDYPERIALGICVLVAFVVLIGFLRPSEDTAIIEANKKTAELKKLISTKEPPPISDVKYSINLKNNWEGVIPAQEVNSWLMYRQPIYEVEFSKDVTAPGKNPVNLPPVFESVTATAPDTVRLAWLRNEKTNVEVKTYRIYRKADDEKNFIMVKEVFTDVISPTGAAYIEFDRTVSATMGYSYYITAYTEDKAIKNVESTPSQQMKINTPNDFDIEWKWSDGTSVLVKIKKYVNGRFEIQNSSYNRGDTVGKGVFLTYFVIEDIQQDKVKVTKSGIVVEKTRYKIWYRNAKTGEKSFGFTEPID